MKGKVGHTPDSWHRGSSPEASDQFAYSQPLLPQLYTKLASLCIFMGKEIVAFINHSKELGNSRKVKDHQARNTSTKNQCSIWTV